ncbi:sensor histidine kinase [Nocardioides pacificus]
MVRQPWRLDERGQWWFDAVLTALLLLPVPVMLISRLPPSEIVLNVVQLVPLWWRRRHAVPVFLVIATASAAQVFVTEFALWSQVAFPIAVYSVARWARPVAGWVALGVGMLAAAVASYAWIRPWGDLSISAFMSYFLLISAIVLTAWTLGVLGRTRQAYVATLVERGERLEREATQRAELAAADERARIAREMHDVVAHGLSLIVVQADGARYAAGKDPEVAATALETIAAAGREALTEMRQMLGLLRSDAEVVSETRPQPGLADLSSLVEDARAGGMRLDATLPETGRAGATALPDGVALTAYRIVQEALTNVRKHAGPDTRVRLRLAVDDALRVEVCDDGRGAASSDDGQGLGLLGMHERVSVHGGTLEAGPRPGGGFAVSARIPL